MSGIVVGLDVRVRKRLVQARDDGLESQFRIGTGKSIGQNISSSNLDRLLEKVVFKDDETGAHRRGVAHNVLPVLQNLSG